MSISGSNNLAVGRQALYENTTGYSNVAVGVRALYSNTDRSNLVAIGDSALYNNGVGTSSSSDAVKNTAIGSKALYANTKGSSNTAIGWNSLDDNTLGDFNTATGKESLGSNTTGSVNCAYGSSVLINNTTGHDNTAIGVTALLENTTGSYRTALGRDANRLGIDYDNSTGIGYNANPDASNKIFIGNSSVSWIGGQVGWGTYSDASIKNKVSENVSGLDFIMRLRPVTYHINIDRQQRLLFGKVDENSWKGKYDIEDILFSGFIAQEVEEAARSANYNFSGVIPPTKENQDGESLYTLRYAEFVVPLVKAVQEQQQTINQLKEKLAEMDALKAEIEQIKKMMNSK